MVGNEIGWDGRGWGCVRLMGWGRIGWGVVKCDGVE